MECAIPTSKKRKILVCCFGSRGDVQPFAALARGLQDAGFQVLGMTNVDYGVSLFEGLGVPAEGVHFDLANMIRTDPQLKRAMASGKAVQLGLKLSKAFVHHFPKEFSKQWEVAKGFQPDLMVATTLLWLQASAIGQALRVPVVHADLGLFSMLPISKHTETELHEPKVLHKMASFVCITSITVTLFQKNKDGESLMDSMQRHVFGPQSSGGGGGLDDASERLLGQDGGGQFAREWMNPLAPNLFGVSDVVLPKSRFTDLPPVYAERTVWTGNWFVSQELQEELARQGDPNYSNSTNDNDNNDSDTVQTTVLKFLRHQAQLRQSAGQPPVAPAYIGWGSMVAVSPEHMTRVAVTSLKVAGLPGIVLGGFARLGADLLPADRDLREYASKHVLFLQSAPHDWLFPHCSVTVHHGGAGTTAAALRSGVPTIVTPCVADQFDNAALIEALECGMGFRKPLRKITESQLAQAMIRCASDNNHHKDMASSTSIAKNCQRVAQALGQEDGIATAVHELEIFFQTRVDTGQWKQDFEARLEQRATAPWSMGRALYRVLFYKEPFVE